MKIFKVCLTAPISEVLCHVEASHLTLIEKQSTGFSIVRVSTDRCLRANFHFSLNVNVNVAVASYRNNNLLEMKFQNFTTIDRFNYF